MSRSIHPLLFAAGGALLAWWLLSPSGDPKDKARITELEGTVTRLEGEIAKREVQLKYLRQRRRVARVDQVVQTPEPESQGGAITSFRFQETDEAGKPLGAPQSFSIRGDIAYFEALVVKFDDEFVERNDLLKGSSLLLFRRIFGEHQAPADGFPLDAVGQRPPGYEGDDAAGGAFYADLWSRFWEYSLDPEVARQAGVRAMHGEAPFVKLAPGKAYEIDLRSSEGLVIRVVDDPGPKAGALQ